MPYAVQVYFDPAIEATVRDLWHRCAQAGITRHLHASANRPHLTLAISAGLDLARAARELARLAATHRQLPLILSHLGDFVHPSPVAFLAPTVTVELLHFHRSVHDLLTAVGAAPQEPYTPGSWVPHCTVAFHTDAANLARALKLCRTVSLPLKGSVQEIGIAEVSPTTILFSTELRREG